MTSINNIDLTRLQTILNISAQSQTSPKNTPTMEDVFQAKTDSIIVSNLSKNIGEAYRRVKQTGDEEAISGFTKIVQNFGNSLSGQEIVDIVNTTREMTTADLTTYGSLANAIDELGSPATMARWAAQAASVYNADAELGRDYMGATSAIINSEYTGNRQQVVDQKLGNLSDFMAKWDQLGDAGEADANAKQFYHDFAEHIGSMSKGEEIAAAIENFNPNQEDDTSP